MPALRSPKPGKQVLIFLGMAKQKGITINYPNQKTQKGKHLQNNTP
jgi:hypothetical protein